MPIDEEVSDEIAAMKTIVMTGGTSGIGLTSTEEMRRLSNVRLLLGARGKAKAGFETLPLDMARLTSVRSFAAAIEKSLGGTSIDGLLLNAGTQVSDIHQRTEDGFEITFVVNHLAHYLLLRLQMPRLASGAIVVITTSNLHDPRTNGVAPPEHVDAEKLARGQVGIDNRTSGARSALHAYATSKLCNLLTVHALASSSFAQERGLRVIAFNPGFTPGTQLTRNHPPAFKLLFKTIVPILGHIRLMNTIAGGGHVLADLALGRIAPPAGRFYASQVKRRLTCPDPPELANDGTVMAKLWRDGAALVGLPEKQ